MGYSSADVHKFMLEIFNDEEFDIFCHDYFWEARHEFSAGMPKTIKIQRLIDYCQRHGQVRALFAALQDDRPSQFNPHFGPLLPDNLEQLIVSAEPGGARERSLEGYAIAADKIAQQHLDEIRTGKRIVFALLALSLGVIIISMLPLDALKPIRLSMIAAGFFFATLTVFPYLNLTRNQKTIGLCAKLKLVRASALAAFQSGDLAAGSQLEQIVVELLNRIAMG